MSAFTIGQIARQAGVGVETIRFYEREGLIQAPSRRASGCRQFPVDAVKRIRFIKRAQELGFSLLEAGTDSGIRANRFAWRSSLGILPGLAAAPAQAALSGLLACLR